MNDLNELITSLTIEEVDAFLAFAKARNQRSDVKNIKLFQLLRKGSKRDLDLKIYGKPNKNALYTLKSRLKKSLIDFTAQQSLASDAVEELEILKQLLAARTFLERKQYDLGFKVLKKATSMALSLQLYSILQEIYHTHVQYAHFDATIALEELLRAFHKNDELYRVEVRLVMAYARLQQELLSGSSDIYASIKKELAHYDIRIDDHLSFKAIFQLMTIATDAATQRSNYASVAIFMNHVYHIIKEKEHLARHHSYYYVEILYLMAGTFFRNRAFTKSMELLSKMDTALQTFAHAHEKQFRKRLCLLKALVFNYTGSASTAIAQLEAIQRPTPQIQLALVSFYFQQEKFTDARKKLNALKHTDRFYEKKEGFLWVVKKNILEIMIFIELGLPDLVGSKMRSFTKRFKAPLMELREHRVLKFMSLLREYETRPFDSSSNAFKQRVENSFEYKTIGHEDIFVMSFYAYLKSKIEQKSIYDTTIELVNASE